ncbi:MAG: hypothetical protein KatS3mg050_0895 [Litorilinea sp.]|nr:MAG: hypothetical protein KatS3mg050_0895 [Litorilinea sp.]
MRVGIAIEETWDFLHEIYADLSAHHQTTLFRRRTLSLPVLNGRLNRLVFQRDLQQFLRQQDVVFFEWASGLLAAATHLPKCCGIVTRLHRYELYQWADRINWDAVDRIILVSEAKRQEFTARFPEQAAKITVIPEAVSLERFRPTFKPFAGDLGILCHLRPRKRVYDLILTFYELLQEGHDFHLHVGGGEAAGFAEYSTALYELVRRLGIGDRVTFYGHVERPEEWYRRIDILISNSYSEGLQVTPLEAMAAGCYCLSHRWEGAEELFPEENLFYTSSELKRQILAYSQLTETERQLKKFALRARVRDHFNVDRTKVAIRQLIEGAALQVAL